MAVVRSWRLEDREDAKDGFPRRAIPCKLSRHGNAILTSPAFGANPRLGPGVPPSTVPVVAYIVLVVD